MFHPDPAKNDSGLERFHTDNFYDTREISMWVKRCSYGTLIVDREAGWVSSGHTHLRLNDQLLKILERHGLTGSFYRYDGKVMPSRFPFARETTMDPAVITHAFELTPFVYDDGIRQHRVFISLDEGSPVQVAVAERDVKILKATVAGQPFYGTNQPDRLYGKYRDEVAVVLETHAVALDYWITKK